MELTYPLQIAGAVFSVLMLYFTHYTYKRGNFGLKDALLWGVVWAWFLFALVFTDVISKLLIPLHIVSIFDLLIASAVGIIMLVLMQLNKRVAQIEKKIEQVVRKTAFEK